MDPITQQTVLACAGAGGAGSATYVDDVFSTFLYSGNGSTQTITNGIDISGEGGLIWFKNRNDATNHNLFDTERGRQKFLSSDTSGAEGNAGDTSTQDLISFNSDGFSVGTSYGCDLNKSGLNTVAWTFRKAPGFFDVVTWTGNGSNRTISHALGSTPGFIAIKRTSASEDWTCYHRSIGATHFIQLNGTSPKVDLEQFMNDTEPTSTHFTVGTHDRVNTNGQTYVAYIFAHDDQSFGDNSDEAIIKCGSFSGSIGNGGFVDLGFEPQWVLFRRIDTSEDWEMSDTMRGSHVDTAGQRLLANTNGTESTISSSRFEPMPTGFNQNITGSGAATVIYIAIRRPHKPPAAGTDVFAPFSHTSSGTTKRTTGFPVDLQILAGRVSGFPGNYWFDRLRGFSTDDTAHVEYLRSHSSSAEASTNDFPTYHDNTGFKDSSWLNNVSVAYWNFKRAPGCLDIVAFVGNSPSSQNVSHNLGVVPEMMILKNRDSNFDWNVYHASLGNSKALVLNDNSVGHSSTAAWNTTTPTASVFTVGDNPYTNQGSQNYIAYLFATLDGISKVGTYTGTGGNLNVDCGFTAGARFVLIKRSDSSGDWYVWDTARGIVSGNDPYLLLNSNATEVTNTDYIDPLNSGFTVTSSAPANLNSSNGTYIFLAIA